MAGRGRVDCDFATADATGEARYSLALPGAAPIGVPNFFIDKFRIPPFLLPIYQAAGMQYGIRWEVLAGINEIETALRNWNVNLPTGSIIGPQRAFTLQASGQLTSAAQYRPVVVAYRITWPDQMIIRGTLSTIAKKVREAKLTRTALAITLLLVGIKLVTA